MILIIDNYDSFTYNLYQMLGTFEPDIRVVRNDAIGLEEIDALAPTHIILSPGPGRPEDAGVCPEVIRAFSGRIALLGVCLGHQAICQAFGARIVYAERLMHGKASTMLLEPDARLFAGLSPQGQLEGARYHSLVADPATIPHELRVTAQTATGEVMAVEHRSFAVFGLQFHPESILTPQGKKIMGNFLSLTEVSGASEQGGQQ
ncbi:MAG: aminodeoxychorismate/anthranilate synthase component II [Coriobacteriales bacterium]|nr:aminodeoxychorismate/anthranilate synthase component II [Coriobacteriales bacterium]